MELVVIGAGAAGLWAAAAAARAGHRVVVLEKTPRPGTKVLASGGTRCNLTTTLGPGPAARLFGEGEAFVTPAFRALPPRAVRQRFAALGVPTVEEPALEKVFPESQRAVDVRDALVRDATAHGARFRYRCPVDGIAPVAGGWAVGVGAEELRCERLLVCVGGQSYPRTGTTGDGYRWLAGLGLEVVPPVPALVPLRSDAAWVHALSGIALPDVEARLLDAQERRIASRRRPVLFTHHGLSGPGAMDLSRWVARGVAEGRSGFVVALDLVPEVGLDELRERMKDAAVAPGGPHVARVIDRPLPARILAAVARQAGSDEDNPPLHRVDRKTRNRWVDALKGLRVPISGTLGWDEAEVTAGGLALGEVDPATMAVRRHPGLYVFGELLDLTGPIGGLNFQLAFATAELAARAAGQIRDRG